MRDWFNIFKTSEYDIQTKSGYDGKSDTLDLTHPATDPDAATAATTTKKIKTTDLGTLKAFVDEYNNITTIKLNNNDIANVGYYDIKYRNAFKNIIKRTNLKELNLEGNSLNGNDLSFLIEAIQERPSDAVQLTLNITNNYIHPTGYNTQELVKLVQTKKLFLDLSNDDLAYPGAQDIADLQSKHPPVGGKNKKSKKQRQTKHKQNKTKTKQNKTKTKQNKTKSKQNKTKTTQNKKSKKQTKKSKKKQIN